MYWLLFTFLGFKCVEFLKEKIKYKTSFLISQWHQGPNSRRHLGTLLFISAWNMRPLHEWHFQFLATFFHTRITHTHTHAHTYTHTSSSSRLFTANIFKIGKCSPWLFAMRVENVNKDNSGKESLYPGWIFSPQCWQSFPQFSITLLWQQLHLFRSPSGRSLTSAVLSQHFDLLWVWT